VRVLENAPANVWGLYDLMHKVYTVRELRDLGHGCVIAMVQERGNTWGVPLEACELIADAPASSGKTTFQRVAEMNEAFGNPKGDPNSIDWNRIRSQFKNVFDEYCEGLIALGFDADNVEQLRLEHTLLTGPGQFSNENIRPNDFRDASADTKVFVDGGSHMAGFDGDADMHTVVDAVFTRFIKDEADKVATIALHAAKGVTDVYFEGEYPKMVMKSASDQPDAPKGKFMKSASYSQPVFA
jgi:hypothetical protein